MLSFLPLGLTKTAAASTDLLPGPAAVVAAHPDDEGLWFSSVLGRVGTIIICLLDSPSRPQLSQDRRAALARYPLPGLCSLGITQADCFGGADWQHPNMTASGIALSRRPEVAAGYRYNYRRLRHQLRSHLVAIDHVFTHAPWGEYGHEEHVQLHRVVRDLQQELGFTLWYPIYWSERTRRLWRRERVAATARYLELATDRTLAAQLKALYQAHSCWTWRAGWTGFDREVFVGQTPADFVASKRRRPLRPGNRISPPATAGKPGLLGRLLSRGPGLHGTVIGGQ